MKLSARWIIVQSIFLVAVGVSIPAFVLWRNIFPVFQYELESVGVFGAGLYEHQIGKESILAATVSQSYPYHRIQFMLEDTQLALGSTFEVQALRDYVGNAYPEGPAITSEAMLRDYVYRDNPSGIPNGLLISNAKSVFVVSRGKAYPFIAPEVFESFGYHWEFVQPKDSDLIAQLETGDKMNYAAVHPDGTLYRTGDGKFFLIWQQQRLPISDQDFIASVWPTFYWVDVISAEPTQVATCKTDITTKKGQIECTFREISTAGLGNSYLFVADPKLSRIDSGHVIFRTRPTLEKQFILFSLGQIKNNLALRYAK